MNAVERLESWFAAGRLLRPDPELPNTVDLTRAVARAGGVDLPAPATAGAAAIEERVGAPQHLVFALVDGLGISLLERLAPDGFFRRHLALELRAVFPSATAAAVTSLATGLWPAEHAVPGWWLRLDEHDLSCVSLPFIDRADGAALSERGIQPEEVYPGRPLLERFTHATCVRQPEPISDSAYSRYARGATPAEGYDTFDEGVDAVAARVRGASAPTYDYLYTPRVDKVSHDHGPQSAEALACAEAVERSLARLAAELEGRARLVISADHGQLAVAPGDKHLLGEGDPLLALLRCRPTGEPRAPLFHVRPEARAAFAAAFAERFGDAYALLSTEEVEQLGLLGPGPLAPRTRQRLGDYLAVARDPSVILAASPDDATARLIGHHGGLLPDEVRIPLIVA